MNEHKDIYSDSFLTILGSIASVFNGLRVVWGALFDYVRFKYLIIGNVIL